MRQVEIYSETPLTDEEITKKALIVFHDLWGDDFTETEVNEIADAVSV